MRDYLIFGVVFGLLPFILKRPVIGVMAFTWLSLMNPHRLTYGAAYDFPFAALVAGFTFVAILFNKESKRFPINSVTILLILFMGWTTLTTFFALEPDRAWTEWNRVMKTFLMVLVAMYLVNSEKDIKVLTWVIGLSLGFYGLKGGLFTLISGGTSRVFGPDKSYIEDNNHLALALLVSLPIVWYLFLQTRRRWCRIGLAGLSALTLASVVGTYSRGALLGGAAMLAFLWLKSRHKMATGLAVIFSVPIILSLMPQEWFDRMESINDYKEDASAMGRINAWGYALNVAQHHLFGGGFDVFTPRMFLLYAPNPLDHHAAHSIYFQVLGEHGFFGLVFFLLLMISAWRTGSRIIELCKAKVDLKWAADLAAMSQVSIVGFAVGGAFLSLAYYDLYYDIIVLLVVLEKMLLLNAKSYPTMISHLPPNSQQSLVKG